jgi:hypothetical protein
VPRSLIGRPNVRSRQRGSDTDLAVVLLPLVLLAGCVHAPPPHLPSHPTWEMFPRASSPPANCPGQYRSVIENADGDVFLGCWGEKPHAAD